MLHKNSCFLKYKNYLHKISVSILPLKRFFFQGLAFLISCLESIEFQTYAYIILDNDQSEAHLLYFTIYLLHSSTCFEHYMLIIRRLNCIDAAPGIVLPFGGRTVHRTGEFSAILCTVWPLTERTIPDAASIQFSLLKMSIQCSKHVEECNKYIVK